MHLLYFTNGFLRDPVRYNSTKNNNYDYYIIFNYYYNKRNNDVSTGCVLDLVVAIKFQSTTARVPIETQFT